MKFASKITYLYCNTCDPLRVYTIVHKYYNILVLPIQYYNYNNAVITPVIVMLSQSGSTNNRGSLLPMGHYSVFSTASLSGSVDDIYYLCAPLASIIYGGQQTGITIIILLQGTFIFGKQQFGHKS